jgi:hypothetical protein
MPRLRNYRALRSESILLLDDLTHRGSIPASFRKSELESLETMMGIWKAEESRHKQDHVEISDENPPPTRPTLAFETPIGDIPELGLEDFESNWDDPSTMSPGHLLSLVEMVDFQEGTMDTDMAWMDAWLWENPEELPST